MVITFGCEPEEASSILVDHPNFLIYSACNVNLVDGLLWRQEVGGSNPLTLTILKVASVKILLIETLFTIGTNLFIFMIKRKLSWKPDLPDQRDYTFTKLVESNTKYSAISSSLPPNISLRKWCSAIEDQQTLGSCTANAIVGMVECMRNYKKIGGINLSRLFVYFNERVIEDTVNEDSGAYIRDGIKSIYLNGICKTVSWPYRLSYFKTKPTSECYKDALNYTISSYYRLNTIDDMKTALANGHPFVFGFSVYDSFVTQQIANTGIVPMPSSTEKLLGGHAVTAIGYDDSKQMFLIRNSWGTSWGLKEGNLGGYFYMPYQYLSDRNLSDDFWTIII